MALAGVQHLSRLSDPRLLAATAALVRQRDVQSALIVAHLSEIAARKAYRPLGYSSLHSYCVYELRLSEHSAYKHAWAVRFALRFPAVLDAIAEGRVHLAGVCELARYITPENAAELLEAATHRTRKQIQAILAERFPKPDLPTLVTALPGATAPKGHCASEPGIAENINNGLGTLEVTTTSSKLAPGQVLDEGTQTGKSNRPDCKPASSATHASAPRSARVAPASPGRYAVQVTISQRAHDLLRRAQELIAHARPGCDVADVLEVALEQLVRKLETRKFGAADRPRGRRASSDSRRVPAEVRRLVAERDGRRCTFVSDTCRRCEERSLLEYDHVTPVARGGRSTVENVRLRCRAHNQLEAEQVYGERFMQAKREQPRPAWRDAGLRGAQRTASAAP